MKLKQYVKPLAFSSMDAGSMILGGMASSGFEKVLIPIEESKIRKATFATLSIVGASFIKGESIGGRIARNLLLGAGVRQGQRFIQEAATPSLPEADGTELNKFVHDMFETGGGSAIASIETQKRMGMGYRFTPQRQLGTATSFESMNQTSKLSFPLT